ncbi:hypothetical protein GCM10008982_05560 [Anoxybacillus voinovskiensis]|nr:hypothetical protein GCM10008982_05560 [Anoxybacillus voinovskiensis]
MYEKKRYKATNDDIYVFMYFLPNIKAKLSLYPFGPSRITSRNIRRDLITTRGAR